MKVFVFTVISKYFVTQHPFDDFMKKRNKPIKIYPKEP